MELSLGGSAMIGFQKIQIYQWFAGSRQEVFILKIENDENNAAQQDNGRCSYISIFNVLGALWYMDKNQGYEIIKAVMLENGRGFALGHHPAAPSPYVTWACYDDKDGQRQYEWGHYGSDRAALEQDFAARVQEYQRLYNVGVKQTEAPGLYKYYSTQRPVDIGTFPNGNMIDGIINNLPVPPRSEKPLDKVREHPPKRRSREREER